MDNTEDGYSRDEILRQLRKIEEEENALYPSAGKQTSLNFLKELSDEPSIPKESKIGDSQEAIDAQPDVDFDALADGSEDPVRLRKLWHGAQALIISNTFKGKKRQFVLDEKNLFLKASANTTDGKFTFLRAVQTVYEMAEKWLQSNADAVELGMAYWDLNERNGFHSRKVQGSFHTTLAAVMKVLPPKRDKK